MRIVIAGYHPADPADIHGGVEAITLRLAEGLALLGEHDLHVVATRPELRSPATKSYPGRTVHLLPRTPHLGNVTLMSRDRRQLRSLFRQLSPDIIHAHSTSEFALAALESGFPTIVSVHGIVREEARLERRLIDRVQGRLRSELEARVLAKVREVMVVSPYVREIFGHHFAHARIHEIETSVSDVFFEVRPNTATPPQILFSGLIIPRKGVLDLIEAMEELVPTVPDVQLRLAGREADSAYGTRVRARIRSFGLEKHVSLLGNLSPPELANELARASLMVLPSFQETAPIAIQEAMAAGVPVIATDVGGNRYLVEDGETGFIVPAGESRRLATAMEKLLSDRNLAHRMGSKAREEASRRFSLRAVAERSVAVYEKVIESWSC